ncbi:MAG TPA: L,D-transpeptidase family protein [Thermodesulfobacteriota bacterium]|nr:L,D-transpeptidase family protein [Thermodesulfobacteriota bacterium]
MRDDRVELRRGTVKSGQKAIDSCLTFLCLKTRTLAVSRAVTIIFTLIMLSLVSPSVYGQCRLTDLLDAGVPPKFTIDKKFIHDPKGLYRFYEQRNYSPAWSNDSGLLPQVDAFVNVIGEAGREGLRPSDYHLSEIEATLEEIYQNRISKNFTNQCSLAYLDLLLTDAFLLYSSHMIKGRVRPEIIDTASLINLQEIDLTQVLRTALDSNQIEGTLKNLSHEQPDYTGLKHALLLYRNIAAKGGWPAVPEGPKMEKGYYGERSRALRQRLIVTGDLDEGLIGNEYLSDENLFDDAVEQAVRNFQRRHGLSVDGIVGPYTLAALNVPVEERIHQLELNMERRRWLPHDLGHRYILVNIADFELYVIEDNQTLMTMRVIVGKPFWNTPVVSAKMSYLILNPYWDIPRSIFIEEILPKIRKDPEYLSKNNMEVLQSWGKEVKKINPKTINWANVAKGKFNYRLRQRPGPLNPLGQIKFIFPNQFHVYLHDTTSQNLFRSARRDFSHGCIRIEKPIDLAEYVLGGNPEWTRAKISAIIDQRVTQTVVLPESIPVYLLYFTAWVDKDGAVQFRDDIYGRDKALDEALRGVLLVSESSQNLQRLDPY